MPSDDFQPAITNAQQFLLKHSVELFESVVNDGDDPWQRKLKQAMLFIGQKYLLENKSLESYTVYECLETFLADRSFFKPPDELETDESGNEFIVDNPPMPLFAQLHRAGYSQTLPILIGPITVFLLAWELEVKLDRLTFDYIDLTGFLPIPEHDLSREMDADQEAFYSRIDPNLNVPDFDTAIRYEKLRYINELGFQIFYFSELYKIDQDENISRVLRFLCQHYSDCEETNDVKWISTWALAGILYAIGKLKQSKRYEKVVQSLVKELHARNHAENLWQWEGQGKIFTTSLVIAAFTQLDLNPAYIESARHWLANQVGPDRPYVKNDLFTGEGIEFDIWATVLALQALENNREESPVSSYGSERRMRIIQQENQTKGFYNTEMITFHDGNTLLFGEKHQRIPLTDGDFALILRLAYQVIVHPETDGWISLGKAEGSPKELSEDDPKASLLELGYVSISNPPKNISDLRKELKPLSHIDPNKLIEKKGKGSNQYRLSSSARLLSFGKGLRSITDSKLKGIIDRIMDCLGHV